MSRNFPTRETKSSIKKPKKISVDVSANDHQGEIQNIKKQEVVQDQTPESHELYNKKRLGNNRQRTEHDAGHRTEENTGYK